MNHTEDSVIGQIQKRIILGFVSNKALNGDRKLNSLNFQHFNLNYLSVYIYGIQLPSSPLQPVYSGKNKAYVTAYHTLLSGTVIHFLNQGNRIDRYSYPYGFCLYVFDLTSDLSASVGYWNLVKKGSVRIEIRFAEALKVIANCVIYSKYSSICEIDAA